MSCARFIVRGKVQGVFFRASTREQALKLKLTGHAKNLPDGGVDVLVSGDTAAIDALERWLKKGPQLATVESVTREDLPAQTRSGFQIA
jgi:acylphosphatase